MSASKNGVITHPGWSEILIAGQKTTLTEIEVPLQIRVACEVCGAPIEWGFEKDEDGSISVKVSKINCDCLSKNQKESQQ